MGPLHILDVLCHSLLVADTKTEMVEEVDLEEGEVTESEEEQSGEEENHLVKPAKSANPPPNKLAGSFPRSGP